MRFGKGIRNGTAMAALFACSASIASETTTYSYDALGRLIVSTRADGPNDGKLMATCFDQAGNRLTYTVGTSTGAACATQTPAPAPSVPASPTSPPSFAVSNATAVTEGGTLTFTVTKTGTTAFAYSVNYASASTAATAGSDYTAASGTLTFAPADTSKTVTIATTDDLAVESPETVLLKLSGETSGATVTAAQGSGTINDNDFAPPIFSVADADQVSEGANLIFTVTKAGTTNLSYSVNYATANGTATAGLDYTAKSGTLTFTPADMSKTISVTTVNDLPPEAAESVNLNLSSPTGGSSIGTGQGTGLIADNDPGNHPPVANSDTATMSTCTTRTIDVVANDTDPDSGDVNGLFITDVSTGAAYDIGISGPRTVEFTTHELPGTRTVTYTVSDAHGATSTGTLMVMVVVEAGSCGS